MRQKALCSKSHKLQQTAPKLAVLSVCPWVLQAVARSWWAGLVSSVWRASHQALELDTAHSREIRCQLLDLDRFPAMGIGIILNNYSAQQYQEHWPPVSCHGSHDSGLCPLLVFPGHSCSVSCAWHHYLFPSLLALQSLLRMSSPEDRSQIQRKMQWACNGKMVSRPDKFYPQDL